MTTELYQQSSFVGVVSAATDEWQFDDPSMSFGDTPAVFNSWNDSAMSLAIWRREPPVDIADRLVEMRLDLIEGWRRSFYVASADSVIAEAMANSGFSPSGLESFLSADMAHLARVFSSSTGTSHVDARLDIIRDDACRRFHVDNYPARLAVTYVGPGTVWVPRCHGGQAIAEQGDYGGPTFEIPAFSVGLFAGEQTGRSGLVHRSPKIANTGRMRLFYCVNAAGN